MLIKLKHILRVSASIQSKLSKIVIELCEMFNSVLLCRISYFVTWQLRGIMYFVTWIELVIHWTSSKVTLVVTEAYRYYQKRLRYIIIEYLWNYARFKKITFETEVDGHIIVNVWYFKYALSFPESIRNIR